MATINPADVRKARAFLQRRGIRSGQIHPRKFAAASQELDVSFVELLRMLGRLYSGGQGAKMLRLELLSKAVEAG